MGKKIGFPTANIDIKNYVLACPGVYAVRVKIANKGKFIDGIANLGYRPTFNGKKILLEVHLFNFSGNLYNKDLTVEFKSFIRKSIIVSSNAQNPTVILKITGKVTNKIKNNGLEKKSKSLLEEDF